MRPVEEIAREAAAVGGMPVCKTCHDEFYGEATDGK